MKVDAQISRDGLDEVRTAARAAESSGYAGTWVAEVKHDPFLMCALAAVDTERIELGTSIAVAFARSPMTTAQQANDLHDLSGGRFILGLGSQVKAHITRRFDMPWSSPAPRMREYVLALRAIWDSWNNGGMLDFRGDFYSHTLMPPFFVPSPNPHGAPRVMLAGVGEHMTRVAGEVADGFLCHGFTTERYLREVTLPALQAGRGASGRDLTDFEIVGSPFVATGSTEEELATATLGVRRQIAFYASTPAYRPVLERHGWGALSDQLHTLSVTGGWDKMPDAIDDEVVEAFAVVGEPKAVVAELRRRYSDVLNRISLYTPYDGSDAARAEVVRELAGFEDL